MPLTIYFDGLCLPKNPGGVATYGFVVKRGSKTIHEEGGLAAPPFTPQATNNVAEYTGVLKALEWADREGLAAEEILVRGDSELVIRQLKGEYKVKSPSIVDLFNRVRALARTFTKLTFEWVPREENGEADAMTNRAYAEFGAQAGGSRRREDASARIARGFSIEVEVPATPDAAFQALRTGSPSLGDALSSSAFPTHLVWTNRDGSTTTVTLTRLADGTRIRCDHSKPAGAGDDGASLRRAEESIHAALLALQSRLDS